MTDSPARSSRAVIGLNLGASVVLALVSGALGLAPFLMEPSGAADTVNCGTTWFRAEGLPSACYTTVDEWAVAAKVGSVRFGRHRHERRLVSVRSTRCGESSTRLDAEPTAA